MDAKFRSRRYRLAFTAMWFGGLFLLMSGVAMLLGKPIDGAGGALGGFSAVAGLILAGYGFTRAKWGGGHGDSDSDI